MNSSMELCRTFLWPLIGCIHTFLFSSQGYENEMTSVRKERDLAVNQRITELKDKSSQMIDEDENLKVALENRDQQLEMLK